MMAYAGVGIVLGVPAALGFGRTLRGMLHGVEPHDPAAIALATLVLALASLIASAMPARRAARVHAIVALRSE